ncbi:MAG: alpha/beta fold hydrolase [Sphingobium sp.]
MTRRMLLALFALLGLFAPMAAQAKGFASDRITVTVQGKGPDVILIPGLTSSPAAWKYAVPAVPGYRYHLVQVKGFAGIAPEGNAKGDLLAGVTSEIARYVAEARLKRPAVIGHSMGGTIALMIGARHPAAIARLMVVDQVPFMGMMFGPPGSTGETIRPTADAILAQMRANSAEAREKSIGAMTGGMVKTDAERPAVVKSALDSDRAVTENTFHDLIVTDLRPELARIAVPAEVLYVTPAGTPFTDAQIDAAYQASYAGLKGAKLMRVPNSAHFIMYDNPIAFHAAMKAFLSGN